MGSSCQKQNEIITAYQQSETIEMDDLRIAKEIYPIKVHRGFRNTFQKNKQVTKIEEATSLSLLQYELQKYSKQNYCTEKIIPSEIQQKQESQKTNKKKIKGIIKPHASCQLIQSSVRLNYNLKNQQHQYRVGQRLHSEKQVRFNLPKIHHNSSRSCSIPKTRCKKHI
ncbi:unnamed protein product (macronuclear) [Paramecium tetraurelia]|uniref:Uncharacterized protein n=1 Tax=Paramecium tetraurelia TaxID=5888 RepID=A0E6H0_PARTE|nr:uncharacterized protein GSPATT00003752001 [Paramecium tetraurelia]CAK90887.1 unnamed protein product [Paramecium tetraurelia]|eukprot:XP_001458284.1 hypothetical protein (macronuclear) [Paramecium tetraurelia strain d4-2]